MREVRTRARPFLAFSCWTVAVAAAWLAVGTQSWAQTVLITAVGVVYLIFPPSRAFPRSLLILSGLLLLLAATALLPGTWMGGGLRQPFEDQGIELPWTFSLQPWWSLEDWTLLFASLLWAWICLISKLSEQNREFLMCSYLVALGCVAVSTLLSGTTIGQSVPPVMQGLGQFENRNQTGDLLVMGGVGSFLMALFRISWRKREGFFWILLTILFMTAIIHNGSRAAVGLFALGLCLGASLVKIRRRQQIAWIILFVVVAAGALIFASAGEVLEARWNEPENGPYGRFSIYWDTAAMVQRTPWFGVGLGNFEGVFNTMRLYSANPVSRMIHPESDWWWIASDLGLTGLFVMGLMVVLGFRNYLRETPWPQLTKASTVLAVLFFIHSLADVGGHRLGTVWSCLYLVSLGAYRPGAPTDVKLPPLFLRALGLLLVVVAFFRVQSASVLPWMPTRASVAAIEDRVPQNLPMSEQRSLLTRGISWAPLDWLLYYQRGLVSLRDPGLLSSSNADFNRALYLEPNTTDLPEDIGQVCRQTDLPEALTAWQELLRRRSEDREDILRGILLSPGLDANERLALMGLAGDDPNLQAVTVISQGASDFEGSLHYLFEENPSLKGISPTRLRELFDRWVSVGEAAEYIKEWPLHPEWKIPGWRAYAQGLAKMGDYGHAVMISFQLMPAPSLPNFPPHPGLARAQLEYQIHSEDPFNGIMLYFAQKAAGENNSAMKTLADVVTLPNPPSYTRYLLAQDLHQAGQDQAAWTTLAPLLEGP
jgi:hypothetical protein